MASEAGKVALLCGVAAAGMLLVALPWVPPPPAPPPLPPQFELVGAPGRALLGVLQWHDEACAQGDIDGFRERVTTDYAASFARRLQALGRALDGASLRAYVGRDKSLGLASAVARGCRGGFARGDRACFVVAAPSGQHGVLGVSFRREDGTFRLDGVEHQPGVDQTDVRAVAAFGQRLVAGP